MIQTQQFSKFLHSVTDICNAESKEKTMWEYWLHKVEEQSYGDFCAAQSAPEKQEQGTVQTLADAVSFTMSMSGFDPEEGET